MIRNNWIILFISLELNLIIFLWIIKKNILNYKLNFFIKYMLYQRINSLLLIIRILYSSYMRSFFIFLILLRKIGLPPFFFWLKRLIKYIRIKNLLYTLIFQKLPFFFIIYMYILNYNNNIIILIIRLGFLVTTIFLYNQFNFNYFFFYRSIQNTYIIIMLIFLSNIYFYLFLFIYLYINLILLLLLNWKILNYIRRIKKSILLLLLLLLLLGLPISPFFILKFFFLYKLLYFSFILAFFTFISIILSIFIYYNLFMRFFNMYTNINNIYLPFSQFFILSWFILFLVFL